MVRRLALVAVALAALACCASPAAAAQRPGATIWMQHGFSGSSIRAIGATPNGGFVAAGMPRPLSTGPYEAWVRAFRPDGSVDASFGDGGTVTFAGDDRWVLDAVVQPDGRIVIAEASSPGYPPGEGNLLRRLTSTGQPDPSFGTDGQTEPPLGPGNDTALTSIAPQRDGKLVLAGIRGDRTIVVERLLADGTPDTAFGSGGHTAISPGADSGPEVELQPEGGIVLVAPRGDRIVIGRLTSNGALDGSFGGGAGMTPVQFARSGWVDRVSANLGVSLVLPTGRIRLGVAVPPRGSQVSRSSLVGLTASGHPDRRFGNHGLALGGPPLQSPDGVYPIDGGELPSRLMVDQRGGLLVVSSMSTSSDDLAAEGRTTIRRFRPNGILDRSFGRKGGVRLRGTYAAYTTVEQAAALVGDRLLVGEHNWNGKYQSDHSARLLALYAGYDRDEPEFSVRSGCHWMRVRIRDLSGLDRMVLRFDGRVVRRTTRKRLRFRVRPGLRVSIMAVDLAGNTARGRTTVPPC